MTRSGRFTSAGGRTVHELGHFSIIGQVVPALAELELVTRVVGSWGARRAPSVTGKAAGRRTPPANVASENAGGGARGRRDRRMTCDSGHWIRPRSVSRPG